MNQFMVFWSILRLWLSGVNENNNVPSVIRNSGDIASGCDDFVPILSVFHRSRDIFDGWYSLELFGLEEECKHKYWVEVDECVRLNVKCIDNTVKCWLRTVLGGYLNLEFRMASMDSIVFPTKYQNDSNEPFRKNVPNNIFSIKIKKNLQLKTVRYFFV